MKCRACGGKTEVQNTRHGRDGTIRRTRVCKVCERREITVEVWATHHESAVRRLYDNRLRKLRQDLDAHGKQQAALRERLRRLEADKDSALKEDRTDG